MSIHIITHVVPYLCSIMHMHLYCYLNGGTAYLLDRGKEWCSSDIIVFLLHSYSMKLHLKHWVIVLRSAVGMTHSLRSDL